MIRALSALDQQEKKSWKETCKAIYVLQESSGKDDAIGNYLGCMVLFGSQQKLEIGECVQHTIHILFEALMASRSCLHHG